MGLFDMFKGNSADKELRANGIDPDDSFVLDFGSKEPLKFTDAEYKCDVFFTYTGESKLRIEDMSKLNGLTSKEKIAEFMEKIVADITISLSGQRSFDNINNARVVEYEKKIKESLEARGISRILLKVNEFELTPESEAFIESLNGKAYENPDQPVPADGYRWDFESSVVLFTDSTTGATVPVRGHGKFYGKIVDKKLFGMEPTVGNLKAQIDKIYVEELMKLSGNPLNDQRSWAGIIFGALTMRLSRIGIEGGMFIGEITPES